MENHLIYYLETYTSSEIIAQTTTFTVLVVILHHFFEIFPCFHYQTVLITDAKVNTLFVKTSRCNGNIQALNFEIPFCFEVSAIEWKQQGRFASYQKTELLRSSLLLVFP